ncbi:LacI family transcriptional regulator [Bacillus sp. UMB0899]|nr:LacI family transcriptional regulator [Bacillus sp. UMB0899]
MKKLLYVYGFLFLLFFLYLYNFHFKDSLSSPVTGEGNRFQGDRSEKFVMVTFLAGIDYWKSALKGFEDAAEELNVSVEYRGATQYDVHEQITVLEQVIARKPAGIAISAIDPYKLNTTINKAIDAGIPVVLFDSDAPSSEALSFIGTNNNAAGEISAHKMAELVEGKGKVAVITLPNQLNHQERTDGFVETIKSDYPKMEVVAIKDGKGDEKYSEEVTAKLIKNDPEIKGIFATEANGGVGIAEAIQANKENRNIKVISFDTDKPTLDKIHEGSISATIAQGTWNMGYWSLQFMFQQSNDLSDIQKDQQLPDYVDTGVSIVTKENIHEYYAN